MIRRCSWAESSPLAIEYHDEEWGAPFDRYVWQFVNGKPIQNHWYHIEDVPSTTDRSGCLVEVWKNDYAKLIRN